MEIFGITLNIPIILITVGAILLIISIIMGIVLYSKENKQTKEDNIDSIEFKAEDLKENKPWEENLDRVTNKSVEPKESIVEEAIEESTEDQDIEVL